MMSSRHRRDYHVRDRDKDRRRSSNRQFENREERTFDNYRDYGRKRRFDFRDSPTSSSCHDDRGKRKYSPPPKVENSFRDSLLLKIKEENNSSLQFSDRKVLLRDDVDSNDNKTNLQASVDINLRNSLDSPKARKSFSDFKSKDHSSKRSNKDVDSDASANDNEAEDEISDKNLRKILIHIGSKIAVIEKEVENHKGDMDSLESLMSKRKKLRKRLKIMKKIVKERYKRMDWNSLKPESICMFLEKSDALNVKASFVIDKIFTKIEDTQDYFGKFGTLSACENLSVQNKIRIEFYNREDTLKALRSKHPEGILFYEDPFPEFENSLPKKTAFKTETPSGLLNLSKLKKEVKSDLLDCDSSKKMPCQEDDKAAVISHMDSALKMKIPKVKVEMKYSPDDFQPNSDNLYVLITKIKEGFFKCKDELRDYFFKFGDVTLMRYEDGQMVSECLNPVKNILVFFEAGHSLLLAVNADHNENIYVDVADECKTRIVYRKSPSPTNARTRRFAARSSGEETSMSRRYSHEDKKFNIKSENFPSSFGIRDRNETDRYEPKEDTNTRVMFNDSIDSMGRGGPAANEREENFVHHDGDRRRQEEGYQRNHRDKFGYTGRKHAYIPSAQSLHDEWTCSKCKFINFPSRKYDCFECGEIRPGNWLCGKCSSVNLPDKLCCHKRYCQTLRKGNWKCPDEDCQRVNWARSLHCYRDRCFQTQPGSWTCPDVECGVLNYRDNDTCFKCKTRNSRACDDRGRGTREEHRSMELSAEKEKQRQALENINKESQSQTSSSTVSNPSENIWCEIQKKEDRRRSKNHEENKKVQNKLLALANNSNDFIDLASDDDDDSKEKRDPTLSFCQNPKNANLEPLGTRPRKAALGSMDQLGESSQSHQKEPVPKSGVINDEIIHKIQHGTMSEQDEILRQFNIVRIDRGSKPPEMRNNIVEVDLVDDSDDDLGKYSDGDSIIEANENVEGDETSINPLPSSNEKETETNGAKSKSDQNLINEIVREDLNSVSAGRNNESKIDDDDDDDDDVIILEAD